MHETNRKITPKTTQTHKKSYSDLEFILGFVDYFRKKNNITPTNGRKPEGSCEMYGRDSYNLLYTQLIYTPFGDSGWLELEHTPNKENVVEEIKLYFKKYPQEIKKLPKKHLKYLL